MCVEDILIRERSADDQLRTGDEILLMNGKEDPYQRHRNCRLHHYGFDDVVRCADHLSNNRHQQTAVHIAFIGESIIRNQFESFLRVNYFLEKRVCRVAY